MLNTIFTVIFFSFYSALQLNDARWQLITLSHASITWIQINKYGYVSIIGMSDDGFIPWNQITVNNAQGSYPLLTTNAIAAIHKHSIETLVAFAGIVIIVNSRFVYV